MSKRVREKCGKLCIFSILHSKRGITTTNIGGNSEECLWRQPLLSYKVSKVYDGTVIRGTAVGHPYF